jgi:hypothetical protein
MEAVLAVWHGDFAEAQRHHEIAAQVHERTELYEAGSGLIATASLLREKGEAVDEATLFGAHPDRAGEGMVGVAQAALLTVRVGPAARAEAVAILRGSAAAAHVWTGLGHTALLAHLCADHSLAEFAPGLLDQLAPFLDRIAILGQVGSSARSRWPPPDYTP